MDGIPVALASGALGVLSTAATIATSRTLSPLLFKGYRGLSAADRREWNTNVPDEKQLPEPLMPRYGHISAAILTTALVAATLIRCPEFFDDGSAHSAESVLTATTALSTATFTFSLGYFLADTLRMVVTNSTDEMLVHHIGGVIALVATLVSGKCHLYGLLLLSTEMTTPFICLRWLLDKAGRRGTQLYLLNGVCIFIGWVLGRLLLLVYVFVHMWENLDVLSTFSIYVQTIAPSIALCLFVLNVFWFGKICRGILRLCSGNKAAKLA